MTYIFNLPPIPDSKNAREQFWCLVQVALNRMWHHHTLKENSARLKNEATLHAWSDRLGLFWKLKMPHWLCVLEDCDNETNLDLGIPIHNSLTRSNTLLKWKRFVCLHRKYFNPQGVFRVCSLHFANKCFTRAFHIKETQRRLPKKGSVPTMWKKTTAVSLSARSRPKGAA